MSLRVTTADCAIQAIPGVFEAVSVPEEEDASPAQSNTSIDVKPRRLSFMSFILGTAPTMEEAILIGTHNQVRSDDDYCVKPAVGHSRRQKILRFFKKQHKHKKQGSTYVSKPPLPSSSAKSVSTSKGHTQRLFGAWTGAQRWRPENSGSLGL